MKFRIISWNINSIRKRIDLLHYLTEAYAPDVVCLQETKVQDPQFPHKAVAELGYGHRFANGISGYNGSPSYPGTRWTRFRAGSGATGPTAAIFRRPCAPMTNIPASNP